MAKPINRLGCGLETVGSIEVAAPLQGEHPWGKPRTTYVNAYDEA